MVDNECELSANAGSQSLSSAVTIISKEERHDPGDPTVWSSAEARTVATTADVSPAESPNMARRSKGVSTKKVAKSLREQGQKTGRIELKHQKVAALQSQQISNSLPDKPPRRRHRRREEKVTPDGSASTVVRIAGAGEANSEMDASGSDAYSKNGASKKLNKRQRRECQTATPDSKQQKTENAASTDAVAVPTEGGGRQDEWPSAAKSASKSGPKATRKDEAVERGRQAQYDVAQSTEVLSSDLEAAPQPSVEALHSTEGEGLHEKELLSDSIRQANKLHPFARPLGTESCCVDVACGGSLEVGLENRARELYQESNESHFDHWTRLAQTSAAEDGVVVIDRNALELARKGQYAERLIRTPPRPPHRPPRCQLSRMSKPTRLTSPARMPPVEPGTTTSLPSGGKVPEEGSPPTNQLVAEESNGEGRQVEGTEGRLILNAVDLAMPSPAANPPQRGSLLYTAVISPSEMAAHEATDFRNVKGVYKNCRGIWAAQWTDERGQRHTKYFNPKYYASEMEARHEAFKFKVHIAKEIELRGGVQRRRSVNGSSVSCLASDTGLRASTVSACAIPFRGTAESLMDCGGPCYMRDRSTSVLFGGHRRGGNPRKQPGVSSFSANRELLTPTMDHHVYETPFHPPSFAEETAPAAAAAAAAAARHLIDQTLADQQILYQQQFEQHMSLRAGAGKAADGKSPHQSVSSAAAASAAAMAAAAYDMYSPYHAAEMDGRPSADSQSLPSEKAEAEGADNATHSKTTGGNQPEHLTAPYPQLGANKRPLVCYDAQTFQPLFFYGSAHETHHCQPLSISACENDHTKHDGGHDGGLGKNDESKSEGSENGGRSHSSLNGDPSNGSNHGRSSLGSMMIPGSGGLLLEAAAQSLRMTRTDTELAFATASSSSVVHPCDSPLGSRNRAAPLGPPLQPCDALGDVLASEDSAEKVVQSRCSMDPLVFHPARGHLLAPPAWPPRMIMPSSIILRVTSAETPSVVTVDETLKRPQDIHDAPTDAIDGNVVALRQGDGSGLATTFRVHTGLKEGVEVTEEEYPGETKIASVERLQADDASVNEGPGEPEGSSLTKGKPKSILASCLLKAPCNTRFCACGCGSLALSPAKYACHHLNERRRAAKQDSGAAEMRRKYDMSRELPPHRRKLLFNPPDFEKELGGPMRSAQARLAHLMAATARKLRSPSSQHRICSTYPARSTSRKTAVPLRGHSAPWRRWTRSDGPVHEAADAEDSGVASERTRPCQEKPGRTVGYITFLESGFSIQEILLGGLQPRQKTVAILTQQLHPDPPIAVDKNVREDTDQFEPGSKDDKGLVSSDSSAKCQKGEIEIQSGPRLASCNTVTTTSSTGSTDPAEEVLECSIKVSTFCDVGQMIPAMTPGS